MRIYQTNHSTGRTLAALQSNGITGVDVRFNLHAGGQQDAIELIHTPRLTALFKQALEGCPESSVGHRNLSTVVVNCPTAHLSEVLDLLGPVIGQAMAWVDGAELPIVETPAQQVAP